MNTSTPYWSVICYACNAPACGVRDRRPEGGFVEAACARHADSTIRAFAACCYCQGPRPTIRVDHELAHKSCHVAAMD